MALLQSHARRTTRRRSDGSPSCQAEGDNAEEGCEPSSSGCTAIVEVQQPGLVPSLKPLPLESNTVQMSSRLGLSGFVPGAAVHIVAALMGLVPFSVGYSMAKLWSAAGWKVADSVVFKAGCYSFIYANGIFPTVVCDYGNGRVGPLPSSEAAQQAMLRTTPLMVSNHMSYLDALILPLALQMPKFMSMSSVKNAPLFGTLGEDLEYIWVNRGSKDSRGAAMQAIDQHVKSWKPGDRPLMIFPEGTTTNGTAILEFKQGAFFSGAPVRPVLLKYTGSWHPAVTDFLMTEDGQRALYTDGEWAMNFWANLVHSCTILVCEPYVPSAEEKADPHLYAANVRQLMLEKQRELELICRASDEQVEDVLRGWRRRVQLQKQVAEALQPRQRLRLRNLRKRGHRSPIQQAQGEQTLPGATA